LTPSPQSLVLIQNATGSYHIQFTPAPIVPHRDRWAAK